MIVIKQLFEKVLVREIGKKSRPAQDIAEAAFERFGVTAPPPTKKRRQRRKKGKGYPTEILTQFGNGIVLE